MAFVIYFFVLIFGAASVLFGLDLMTAPLPTTPNVPIGHRARHIDARHIEKPASQNAGRAQAKSESKSETKSEAKAEAKAELDDRKLSPIHPASPAGPKSATTGTVASDVGSANLASQDAQAQAEIKAQSDVQPAQNHCAIQACSNAYVSFRASDCTYQPYEGPRRLCDKASGPTTVTANAADAAKTQRPSMQEQDQETQKSDETIDDQAKAHVAHRPSGEGQESDAARIVRQMTRGQGEADIPVLGADGRVIIVHTGGARAQASAACDVTACARAYSSFDASDCTYQPYDGMRRLCRR